MITSTDFIKLSYQELEVIFNAEFNSQLEQWKEDKQNYISNPTSYDMPECSFAMWFNLRHCCVGDELTSKLVANIEAAGWWVSYKWQKDERTGADQLYLQVLPK